MFKSALLALTALLCTAPLQAADTPLPAVTVFGPEVCLACIEWTDHLRQNGFQASYMPSTNMAAVKRWLNVPSSVESVLTARVGRYFIEGHVPADDIKQLLKEKPHARGLAVPGLPRGAPGYEGTADAASCETGCTILDTNGRAEREMRREPFTTLLIAPDGSASNWARH